MTKANGANHPDKLNVLFLKTTGVFWLACKLLCYKLWLADRLYPLVPVSAYLNAIPNWLHVSFFVSSIALLVLLILFKPHKSVISILLVVELCSCLLDQNRWQPWEYQCLFTLFVFLINFKKPQLIAGCLIFIWSATYFYSGCSKLSTAFLQNVWEQTILHKLQIAHAVSGGKTLYFAGLLCGLFEIVCGLGLLHFKTRRLAAIGLITMHLFVLWLLGPLGLNFNRTIWPWNAGMIAYFLILLLNKDLQVPVIQSIFKGFNPIVFACWGILPALSFWGLWDGYLSSNLYSGKLPQMTICVSDTTKCKALQRFFDTDRSPCNNKVSILVSQWAMDQTGAPPYPELRVYRIIQKKLECQYPKAGFQYFLFSNGQYKKLQ